MKEMECDRHFADELLETYSIGHLPEDLVPVLEEHLLLCEDCQERLSSIDQYVQVAKAAAAELDRRKSSRKRRFADLLGKRLWHIPKPVWALGLATASMAVLFSVVPPLQVQKGHQTELTLIASRGREAMPAHASSQDTILFRIDGATIPAAPAYRLQLVNATGAEVWKSSVMPKGNLQLSAQAPKLSRGKYWLRIYNSTDLENPLQEYGLTID